MRKIAFLILFVLAAGVVSAQYTVDNKKAVNEFEKGQALLSSNPVKAFEHFEKALKAEPSFAEVHLTMAAWLMDHDSLDLAEEHLRTFLRTDKGKHKRWGAGAEHDLKCIAFRREAMANPVPFTPVNMGPAVNSPDDEYLPTLTADGRTLLFTRYNRPSMAEDFYYSRLIDGKWSKAVRMAEPLNSDDNEGAGCISQDGRILYFTACGRPDGAGRCDLYISYRKAGGWSQPQNLGPAVNTSGWESQPCLSIDGQTLYFVSDRKDGYGGMDIWRSTLVEGRWSKPVNMGPGINTKGDEKSPFISFDNQTLYFSSNGYVGMGGMDLFVCRRTGDTTWSEPQNLGYPSNTRGDESSLIVSPDGRTAIFSSAVVPTDLSPETLKATAGLSAPAPSGGLDLYSFALPETVRPEPVEYKEEITEVAPELKVGESITLKNVFFQTGKYTLLDISIVELDKVVEMMQRHPSMRIELGGHTDNVGSEASNQKLSEQRAKAVYDYLVQHGVPAERLTYKGYGQSQPVADNSTPEGRRQNRRTVFTIIAK